MFGSNNHDQNSTDNSQASPPAEPVAAGNLTSFTMDPPKHDDPVVANATLSSEPTGSPVTDASTAPHVDDTAPAADSQSQPAEDTLADTSAQELPTSLPSADDDSNDEPSSDERSSDNGGSDDLLSIKQQALSQLSPLVSHLDQSPEDKFKTLMMMIQANDNQALIKDAYETAQQITDDKAKSQALLDVVNEINYFTKNKD